MTIREHLKRNNRRYRIAQGVCFLLALAGGFAISFRQAKSPMVEPSYLLVVLTGLAYLALLIAGFIPLVWVRCPQCRGRTGPLRKKWKHCPFCGVSLDREME